jgi:hypothetical protein
MGQSADTLAAFGLLDPIALANVETSLGLPNDYSLANMKLILVNQT